MSAQRFEVVQQDDGFLVQHFDNAFAAAEGRLAVVVVAAVVVTGNDDLLGDVAVASAAPVATRNDDLLEQDVAPAAAAMRSAVAWLVMVVHELPSADVSQMQNGTCLLPMLDVSEEVLHYSTA